jgi:hypothetical protein
MLFPNSRRSVIRSSLAALGACTLLAAMPATTVAAPGSGSASLALGGKGKAAKALAASGVKVAAIAPAKKRRQRITLPVQNVTVGKSATVALRGGLRFKAGKRTLRLRAVRLTVKPRRVAISMKAGKRRVAVFAAKLRKGKAKLNRSDTTAKLVGATLTLTRKGARLLRAKLDAASIVAGKLGKLGVDAKPRAAGGGGGPGGGGPGGGGPGGGGPQSGPIKNEPPVMPRPESAVDVGGIAITWYPRDSFIRYLTSGIHPSTPQNGFFVSGGATKGAPMMSSSHPCSDVAYDGTPTDKFDYAYQYEPKFGWYDPPTQTAAIYGQGNVRFGWASHTIDLTASDPEIELNPTSPRTIFRFNGGAGTAYPNKRAVLTNLDLADQPTVSPDGKTRTYTAVRGRLSEDGQAVFADFYPPPNDEFGCVTVSFSTP